MELRRDLVDSSDEEDVASRRGLGEPLAPARTDAGNDAARLVSAFMVERQHRELGAMRSEEQRLRSRLAALTSSQRFEECIVARDALRLLTEKIGALSTAAAEPAAAPAPEVARQRQRQRLVASSSSSDSEPDGDPPPLAAVAVGAGKQQPGAGAGQAAPKGSQPQQPRTKRRRAPRRRQQQRHAPLQRLAAGLPTSPASSGARRTASAAAAETRARLEGALWHCLRHLRAGAQLPQSARHDRGRAFAHWDARGAGRLGLAEFGMAVRRGGLVSSAQISDAELITLFVLLSAQRSTEGWLGEIAWGEFVWGAGAGDRIGWLATQMAREAEAAGTLGRSPSARTSSPRRRAAAINTSPRRRRSPAARRRSGGGGRSPSPRRRQRGAGAGRAGGAAEPRRSPRQAHATAPPTRTPRRRQRSSSSSSSPSPLPPSAAVHIPAVAVAFGSGTHSPRAQLTTTARGSTDTARRSAAHCLIAGVARPSSPGAGGAPPSRASPLSALPAVSPFLAWIGSPCLRHCAHGASIGAGAAAAQHAEAAARATGLPKRARRGPGGGRGEGGKQMGPAGPENQGAAAGSRSAGIASHFAFFDAIVSFVFWRRARWPSTVCCRCCCERD
jgi:hypothetical protein